MLFISILRLLVEVTVFTIRITIELLTLAGRLFGFLYREVVMPGAQAAGQGLVNLAGVIAARRAARTEDWTDNQAAIESWRHGERF